MADKAEPLVIALQRAAFDELLAALDVSRSSLGLDASSLRILDAAAKRIEDELSKERPSVVEGLATLRNVLEGSDWKPLGSRAAL